MGTVPIWELPYKDTPPPPPLEIPCFHELGGFCAQALERVGLAGKVFLTKGLRGMFGERKEMLAGRWAKNRERTGPSTGRITLRGRGNVRLPTTRTTALPHPSMGRVGQLEGCRIGRRSRVYVIAGGQFKTIATMDFRDEHGLPVGETVELLLPDGSWLNSA